MNDAESTLRSMCAVADQGKLAVIIVHTSDLKIVLTKFHNARDRMVKAEMKLRKLATASTAGGDKK